MTPEDLDQRFRAATPDYPYGGYGDDGEPAGLSAWELLRAVLKVLGVVAGVAFVIFVLCGGV